MTESSTLPPFDQREVDDLVAMVWESVLGESVLRGDGPTDGPTDERWMSSRIDVVGAWTGEILIRCPDSLVTDLASAFLCTGSGNCPVTDEDRTDAVAEITNITGGHLKSLAPSRCFLGLASVVEGTVEESPAAGAAVRADAWYQVAGAPFRVVVTELAGR